MHPLSALTRETTASSTKQKLAVAVKFLVSGQYTSTLFSSSLQVRVVRGYVKEGNLKAPVAKSHEIITEQLFSNCKQQAPIKGKYWL